MRLTTQKYWDKIWEQVRVPIIIDLNNPVRRKFHKLFLNILPKSDNLKILEIGCSPGAWLIYFNTIFGYDIYGIDYSDVGCKLTKKNFCKCSVNGTILRADFFNNPFKDSLFDIVFSYGFIEHFTDTIGILREHMRVCKNGGYLVIVIPNMNGIIGRLQKLSNIGVYNKHKILSAKNIELICEYLGIDVIKCGYFGNFNLGVVKWNNRRFGLISSILNRVIWKVSGILNLDNLESKTFSPYIVVVGRVIK